MNQLWNHILKMPAKKKIMLFTSIACTMVLLIGTPVYAWFSYRRDAAIMTRVNSPTTLFIYAGGQQEDAANINLGDIEIDSDKLNDPDSRYKEFIFCVAGKDISYYDIQLAHTTNIPFTYELFHAFDVTDSENAAYLEDSVMYESAEIEDKYYYYAYGDRSYVGSANRASVQIAGDYLNRTAAGVSDGSLDNESYDPTENVQINAYPVYWQNTSSINIYRDANSTLIDKIKSEGFADYYILRVSWDSDINLTYKETDIVYITARVGSEN